jgi:hypothetical protein
MAAEAAKETSLDIDKTVVTEHIAARGNREVPIMLRNWTNKPRAWKAESGADWITMKKTSGSLAGVEKVILTLDGNKLETAKSKQTAVIFTDTGSGKKISVAVNAGVTEVLRFVKPHQNTKRNFWGFKFIPHKGRVPFNVTAGSKEKKKLLVHNRSQKELSWTIKPSHTWLKVEPSSGKAAPESPITLHVTAAPSDKGAAYYEPVITIKEANGPASVDIPLAVHVIPAYKTPPVPQGEAVKLDSSLYKALIKKYNGAHGAVFNGPGQIEGKLRRYWKNTKEFDWYIRGGAPYEAIFNIEGKGYSSFSAHVGFPSCWNMMVGMHCVPGSATDRLNYEIYVDGKIKAQSGIMGPKDGFRLLAVSNLKNAKQLRFVVRTMKLPPYTLAVVFFNPTFYK